MLYIADLRRNGLLKIGVAGWYRLNDRKAELRRKWNAPKLQFISYSIVPYGWGTEEDWERRLIERLKHGNGTLQLFASDEPGRELVDSTPEEARDALAELRSQTEIDSSKDADEISANYMDWRFCNTFLPSRYTSGMENSISRWREPIMRQIFIQWLRGNEYAPIPARILGDHLVASWRRLDSD
jgi:hypothetical protein